jgi:probable HAF family extracellular repeat protein
MRLLYLLPALVLSCALVAEEPATAQIYSVTDLGTLPGTAYSQPFGINESGQVTGWATSFMVGVPNDLPSYAFLYDEGKLMDIGTLGLPDSSLPYGIAGGRKRGDWERDDEKSKTRVTGFSGNPQSQFHAFLYEDHFMRDLGVLPGGTQSTGYAVNRSGEVVGDADNSSGVTQPFLYKHGNMVSIGTLGSAPGLASGINDEGDITGYTSLSGLPFRGFLYHDDKIIDLGTLPGAVMTFPHGINDRRQITGDSSSTDFSFSHAFLWSNGVMTDLGTLPGTLPSSTGSGINSQGQVVGYSQSNSGATRAFLYSDGHMRDLNSMIPPNSGWTLYEAKGINDRGEITGLGSIHGEGRAYLLTLDCKDHRNKECEPCRNHR